MIDEIALRDVTECDLPIFFEQQLDPGANHMAAFTAGNPADKAAFAAHWARILSDEGTQVKTVVFLDHVAGYVASFERFGKPEVTYWIGKEFWGKGIATRALSEYLRCLAVRPLYARAVKDNQASMRVLEKCGFAVSGHERAFANGRGEEVEEVIFILE